MTALHGWLILDKPVGLGSTQAVGAVKRALRRCGCAKVKVGHGGTLDPLASGVLPIALGEATKLSGRMLDADKGYDFTIAFGAQTDTLDGEGVTVAESAARPTLAAIEAVLPRFTGPITQVPPAFSALKVDGKRAYALAREGAEVHLAEREVTVHALDILPGTGRGTIRRMVEGALSERPVQPHPPSTARCASGPPPRAGEELSDITLSALVSKGTYIRSLARDVALALGTVGHVTMLRRTKAGPFALGRAISLDILNDAATEARLRELLLPLTAGLDDIPVLAVSPDQAQALRQGRRLAGTAALPGLSLAMHGDMPIALVEMEEELRVVRGFNPMSE